MADSKLRIPRVAVAALVLGGACGDDNDNSSAGNGSAGSGSAAGTNVSAARISKLASMYCELYAKCDPEYFTMYYDNKADCVRAYAGDFNDYVETYGKLCADAILDMVECRFSPECSSDADQEPDPKCDPLAKKLADVCPDDLFGDEYSYASSSLGKATHAKRRSLRIPR